MLVETVSRFKTLYSEKKDIIDYMEQFGNEFERVEAMIIKKVALDI